MGLAGRDPGTVGIGRATGGRVARVHPELREHPTFADRDLSSVPALRDSPVDIAMVDVPYGYPLHRTMSETAGGFTYTDMRIVDLDGVAVPDGVVGEL